MPSFEEGLAGGIQIECHRAVVEKGIDLDARMFRIDAGSLAARHDELIANGVFDPECKKVQAGEGATARADLDLYRLRRRKPIGPGECIGCPIDIVLCTVETVPDLPEHPTGDVGFQIHPIHGRPGGSEADATLCLGRDRNTEAMELCFEHPLQSAWAGCKEPQFCAIHDHR